MKRIFSTFIFVWLLLSCTLASELHFIQYRLDDGLPNNTVRCIFQDSHDFMWLATLNGLSRFDGTNFMNFRHDAENKNSLPDNRIYKLTEDKDNFLWIGTTARIYGCFDLQKGKFAEYDGDTPGSYSKIFVASDGDVWLGGDKSGALRVRHAASRKLESRAFDKASRLLPDNKITCINETPDGKVIIGTLGGIAIVSDDRVVFPDLKKVIFSIERCVDKTIVVAASGEITFLEGDVCRQVGKLPPGCRITATACIKGCLEIFTSEGVWMFDVRSNSLTRDGRLDIKNGNVLFDNLRRPWIFNHSGTLTFFSETARAFKTLELIPPSILAHIDNERFNVTEDADGIIWISTYGNGLYSYEKGNGKLTHYKADASGSGPIKSDYIRYMTLDSSGGLWIATEYSGVTRLWKRGEAAEYFYPAGRNAPSHSNAVRMVSPMAEGIMLIATKTADLFKWNPQDGVLSAVGKFPSNVYCVLPEEEGVNWYGTRGSGLFVGDANYRHEAGKPGTLPDDDVYFVHRDKSGRIWTGTFGGGIALAVPGADGVLSFKAFAGDIHGVKEHRCINEDRYGRFWIGTSEGVVTFHPDSILSSPSCFKTYSRVCNNFCSNEIRHLFRDSSDRLWIATGDAGVICASTNAAGDMKVERHLTSLDGLSNNSVQSIIEDDAGDLWFGTEYGLSRFNVETHSFENFFFSKNVLQNVYSENCIYKADDGSLILGTNNGVVRFNPSGFSNTTVLRRPLRFTGLKVNGQSMLPENEGYPLDNAVDYARNIHLKYFQNSITVDFAILDFCPDDNYRYSYMLEGYDTVWCTPSSEGSASYKYLPPGNYVLKVKCLDGSVCVGSDSIDVVISRPWWGTVTAKVVYVFLVIAAVWIIFRVFRRKRHLPDNVDKLEVDERQCNDVCDASSADRRFIERFEAIALENISNSEFSMDDFASQLNVGRAVFYRKLRALLGTSPNDYMKKLRLERGAELLKAHPELSISEISDMVGFNDSLYFSKCFKSAFGISPSSYRDSR